MSDDKPQLKQEHLAHMTPDQIVAARREGLLDDVMAGSTPEPEAEVEPGGATPGGADQGARGNGPPAGTRAWLKWLGPQRVVELRRAGKLDGLLRGEGKTSTDDPYK